MQTALVTALAADPCPRGEDTKKSGVRTAEQLKLITPLLESLTVFQRTCKQLEAEDYEELARCVKLERAEKNTRLFDCGDPSTELMVVLRGQIGVIYPDSLLMDLIKAGPDARKERVELLTEAQAETKKSETIFITGRAGSTGNVQHDREKLEWDRRLQEGVDAAKQKNATYQAFDAMLGL